VVINNLDIPWEVIWGPDDWLWVTERNGRISRVNPNTGQQSVLFSIPEVRQVSESGLLGMVLHPDFGSTPQVFVAYTYNTSGGLRERIVRYTYASNTLSSPLTLLENIPAGNVHNGARLLITPDRKLLATTGDSGNSGLSQNLNSLAGKILRLELDGKIPTDNPIAGSYVYSFGHRNPQGLFLRGDGKLFSTEHGPNTDDEINLILPTRNYGWPTVVGNPESAEEVNFAQINKTVNPLLAWTPTIAISDLTYYTSNLIPQWRNKWLITTLKDQRLVVLTPDASGEGIVAKESFFNQQFGRLRDIAVAPDGRVFLATNGSSYSNSAPFTHQIIEVSRGN
jgi:PQQ-dependent dehydrogenase (s-GDH family)